MRARIAVALGALALGALVPRAARAQASDPAAAVDLFHQGRTAMSEGDYDLACSKFAESQRFDARVGTLINLALCEEARHRLTDARRYWEQATDLARATGDGRSVYTTEHLEAIDRKVPRLTIRLASSAPAGTVVRRDDVELGPASLGTPLPVDPGEHAVVAVAAHHTDGAIARVSLAEGESKELVVEPGEPILEPAPVASAPGAQEPVASRVVSPWRVAAVASGAAGMVGLGLGAYFGVRALDGKSGSPGVCHGDVCDTLGASARRDAIRSADASTVAFIAGGALLTTGVVFWLVAPAGPRAPVIAIAPSGPGATLAGTF